MTDRDRPLPVNYEVEQALLGAILRDTKYYDVVAPFVRPHHFAEPVHGRIYESFGKEIEAGREPNALTLASVFEQDGALKDVGKGSYIRSLAKDAISPSLASSYGRTIVTYWQRRRLIQLGEDLIARGFDVMHEDEIPDAIGDGEIGLSEIAVGGAEQTQGAVEVETAAQRALEDIEEARRMRASGDDIGLHTGLSRLDAILTPLVSGELMVIGGRPSMGKSALALNIAEHVARAGNPALIFSLEMTAKELATRYIASASGQDLTKVLEGDLSDSEFDSLIRSVEQTRDLPMYLDESHAATMGAIAAKSRALKRKLGRLGLVVIDYLQLMSPDGKSSDNRVQDVSTMSRATKLMAVTLDVPVILLSQLSRASEQRENKRPRLADLRESGAIEQDADKVLLLFREEVYTRNNEIPEQHQGRNEWLEKLSRVAGDAEIIIAKQRNGPAGGTVHCEFDGPRARFKDKRIY